MKQPHFNVHTGELRLTHMGQLLRLARYPDSNCARTLRLIEWKPAWRPWLSRLAKDDTWPKAHVSQEQTTKRLFIPVQKVKIHLISWRYNAVYDECSFYQPPYKMGDTICPESFALSVYLKS